MRTSCFLMMIILLVFRVAAAEGVHALDDRLHHLRIDAPREWAEFPDSAAGPHLDVTFTAKKNADEWSLRVRQQDVKQAWQVKLNGKPLGNLVRDENDMVVYFPIPANTLADGENVLHIGQAARGRAVADDIRVGELRLNERSLNAALNEATLAVEVVDRDAGTHLPSRITVLSEGGALQTTGAKSNDHLAVRQGIVYTSSGKARFGLPAGKYRIFAGRGFEYSLDNADVALKAGQTSSIKLAIRRQVNTDGYVACDTHVHTLTHSGHGDATVQERMITLAAEGIELPVATDHNVHVDHEPFAQEMKVRQYFTPVIGNEVTTPSGHFNIFPVRQGANIPDYKLTDWNAILDGIYRTPGVKIAILNHARDVHRGVRPFGPQRFNAAAGENLDGWAMRFNAMEVVNSSATQTDPLQLCRDWMSLLNRGRVVTPVGSSDSHDVGRHFVGQGRTYIRCDDRDPGNIDVEQAVNSFVQGRVIVSYGLAATIRVGGKYGPGEMAPVTDDEVQVEVSVLGPDWVTASHVALYANGQQIREAKIAADKTNDLPDGIQWAGEWNLPRPKYDLHLVAIATGPGIDGLYWKTAKPYQPTSPHWQPKVIGCSGAVWLDGDGDGRKTAAFDYAQRLFASSGGDAKQLVARLENYDRAVAVQAAHLYQSGGKSLLAPPAQQALGKASDETKAGFRMYLEAWRENQFARASK